MSLDWGVTPIVPEIHDWLEKNGFEITSSKTRYPTLEELILVLETFNLPIIKEPIKDNLYGIVFGELYTDQYAYILGSIEEEGFNFHFWGNSCQERTMLEILKRLSEKCGDLVIYNSGNATPLIVHSKIDVENALLEWGNRIAERFADSPPDTKGIVNGVENHLNGVTLYSLLDQLDKIGISEKTFANSIGMSIKSLFSTKASELTDNPSGELRVIKLACLWIIEHHEEIQSND